MISDKSLGSDVYADFSGFETMRKAARENDPKAVHAVAKQLEGVFLNMMMSSMREANQLFSEDSLLSSKDVKFYEQMLDQQLSVTLTEGKGIGLADQLTKQLTAIQGKLYDPENGDVPNFSGGIKPEDSPETNAATNFDVARYRVRVTPVANGEVIQGKAFSSEAGIQPKPDSNQVLETESTKNQLFQAVSPQDFVDKIVPYAKKAAATLGVPVESVVAQAALETGWGRYMMKHKDGTPALNFFGIKADKNWQGNAVQVPTLEYRNGVAAKESASFRSYASLDEAFQDYSNFLSQKPRYQQALQQTRENNDAKAWGERLQTAGYATDPNYGKKIASIVSRLQKDDAFQQRLSSITSVSK